MSYLEIAIHKSDGSVDVVSVPVSRVERLLIAFDFLIGRRVRIDRP